MLIPVQVQKTKKTAALLLVLERAEVVRDFTVVMVVLEVLAAEVVVLLAIRLVEVEVLVVQGFW